MSYPEDRLLIRDLIENWRCTAQRGLGTVRLGLADGARKNATWFQGPYEDFIEASPRERRGGADQSIPGGTTIDVRKARRSPRRR